MLSKLACDRVKECQILLLNGQTKGCFQPPPYLDDYGETDQGLKYDFSLTVIRVALTNEKK